MLETKENGGLSGLVTHFTVEDLEFRSAIVCLSSKKSLEKIKNAEEKPPQIKQEDIFFTPSSHQEV